MRGQHGGGLWEFESVIVVEGKTVSVGEVKTLEWGRNKKRLRWMGGKNCHNRGGGKGKNCKGGVKKTVEGKTVNFRNKNGGATSDFR